MIYYQDNWTTVINADVRDGLKSLASNSVNCVVTSPPYWSLRNYGIPSSAWGGNPDCSHLWSESIEQGRVGWESTPEGQKQFKAAESNAYRSEYKFCNLCNAWLGCLGLEPTIEMFVANMVEVFREVKRVLRDDGVLWLNMGDSFANDGKWGGNSSGKNYTSSAGRIPRRRVKSGLKPKDLCMIPHRLAIALQMDGWYVRMDCVWSKPNAMPESVNDRPSKSHEYVFLLSKSPSYFYDATAVRETSTERRSGNSGRKFRGDFGGNPAHNGHQGFAFAYEPDGTGRNRRSVWTIPTAQYADAHFATFPKDLIRPCILAGCPEKVCSVCGEPRRRITKKTLVPTAKAAKRNVIDTRDESADRNDQGANRQKDGHIPGWANEFETTGWTDCGHDSYVAGVVLDPFAGSGTTLQVAMEQGCKSIGIELNPKYCALIKKRVRQGVLNFEQVS